MATQFLDDVIQGHQVIQSLNVADLNSGEHKFWFRIATNALSQWQHLPVLVFKGEKPGKKIMITAGVHGDEYNGVLAAQKTARELIGTEVAGTVTIVPTINMPGMLNLNRALGLQRMGGVQHLFHRHRAIALFAGGDVVLGKSQVVVDACGICPLLEQVVVLEKVIMTKGRMRHHQRLHRHGVFFHVVADAGV